MRGVRRRLTTVIGCMRTRRTTRRAQVLKAHAVVIGALLSALARPIHRQCRQMRLAAGLACIRRVSSCAHTIAHTTTHTGTCSGTHTCRCLHPKRRIRTQRTCTCTQPDRRHQTHRQDIIGKTHTDTHTHTARQTASHTQMGYRDDIM